MDILGEVNVYQVLSVILGIYLFLPLSIKIWRREADQNLATFILWGSLDVVAAISTYLKNGNYYLPAAYAMGSMLIIFCILSKQPFKWRKFETWACLPVMICIIAGLKSGAGMATILSTTGVVLAGLPQIKDNLEEPEKCPTLLYVGYTIANLLGTLGGKAWTIEERLYPASTFVLCLIIVLTSIKWSKNSEAVS